MTHFYIFDLDGALYSYSKTGIGKQFMELIHEFFVHEFTMTPEEATAYVGHTFKNYGIPARAIQVERKVSKTVLKKFCSFIHLVDVAAIRYDQVIVDGFKSLASSYSNTNNEESGFQLWIMTNSTKQHASACLAQLGISEFFRDPVSQKLRVVDCFDQWSHSTKEHEAICKPLVESYEYMLKVLGADAAKGDTFVMVEDSMKNLEVPKQFGWRTIFITDDRDELVAEALEQGHVVHGNIRGVLDDLVKSRK